MPDPSSFSLPPEDRARMLAAMAGAIDGGFWTSPDGNSGGSPGEIATAMLCALEPLLAERWDGLKEACRREMAHHFALPDAELAAERDQARAEARGLREALEGLRDLRAISFISTQHALDSYVDAVQRRVDAALSASPDTETRGAGLLDIADEVKEVATSLTHVPGLEPEVLDDHVTDLLVIAGRLREPSRPVSVPEQEEGCCVAARGSHPPDCPCECHGAASSSSSEEGERGRVEIDRELKVWPVYFDDILSGAKTWEIRRNDAQGFGAGRWVRFREWDPDRERYTGRTVDRFVTYVAALDRLPGMDGRVGMTLAPWKSLRERLTSDEAVEAGAAVLRERFERWGVTGHGRDTTRDLLAAVADRLENRTEDGCPS